RRSPAWCGTPNGRVARGDLTPGSHRVRNSLPLHGSCRPGHLAGRFHPSPVGEAPQPDCGRVSLSVTECKLEPGTRKARAVSLAAGAGDCSRDSELVVLRHKTQDTRR